jgi:hypothetical protein
MEIIEIDKNLIPYRFKMKFSNRIFQLGIRYNDFADRLYIDLFDDNGNIIQDNEVITYGIPLFKNTMEDINGNLNPNYPDKYIQPLAPNGIEVECNLKNFGVSYFLALRDR